LKKEYFDGNLIFVPGILTNDIFSQQNLTYRNITILKIVEELKFDNQKWGKTTVHIRVNVNGNLSEISVSFFNWQRIWYSANVVNGLNKYIDNGFDILKIKTDNFCYPKPILDHSIVIDDVEKLVVKEYYEVIGRVGKDNRIESGTILENVSHDVYFRLLLTGEGFIQSENQTFVRHDEVDYAYIPSQQYSELIVDGRQTKNRLLFSFGIKYNNELHQLLNLQVATM
jgi:hypothetical protein